MLTNLRPGFGELSSNGKTLSNQCKANHYQDDFPIPSWRDFKGFYWQVIFSSHAEFIDIENHLSVMIFFFNFLLQFLATLTCSFWWVSAFVYSLCDFLSSFAVSVFTISISCNYYYWIKRSHELLCVLLLETFSSSNNNLFLHMLQSGQNSLF